MAKNDKKEGVSFFDSIKLKLLDMAQDYIKEKVEVSKNEILKGIERRFEKKIKREIRKIVNNSIFLVLILLGGLFLLLGGFMAVSYILNLPYFVSFLSFGFFLIIIALIFKL